MSNESNVILLERAHEQMEYWTGTLHEKLIQHDIDSHNWEQLAVDVKKAQDAQAEAEYNPHEVGLNVY